jgi:hypothetical protein
LSLLKTKCLRLLLLETTMYLEWVKLLDAEPARDLLPRHWSASSSPMDLSLLVRRQLFVPVQRRRTS